MEIKTNTLFIQLQSQKFVYRWNVTLFFFNKLHRFYYVESVGLSE